MIECNKINSDFVTIVTPNEFYCEPTLRVMNAGFNVVEDGVRGMQFIETMVRARYDKEQEWHKWVEKNEKTIQLFVFLSKNKLSVWQLE